MRLTPVFAINGLLLASLLALPLWRLWAVAVQAGDSLSRQMAVVLAVATVVVLLALFVVLWMQLLAPLGRTARALVSDAGADAAPTPRSRLSDLAALQAALPSLRRGGAGTQQLEAALQRTRDELAAQAADFEARSRYLQALLDAIALPLALQDPEGRDVLVNRSWRERSPAAAGTHRSPISGAAGSAIGMLVTDMPLEAPPPRHALQPVRAALHQIIDNAEAALQGRLDDAQRVSLQEIAVAATGLLHSIDAARAQTAPLWQAS